MKKNTNEVDSGSLDLTKENIEKLKNLFPEILADGRINFDKLRLILGDAVDDSAEKYSFNWHGKRKTIKIAQQSTTATLRPNKDKSRDWDNTQNIYIEGDNLEVLKTLQKSYSNRIKMIYIDPPYNTGKDFVYKDNFHDSMKNYMEQTGQVDSEGNSLSVNPDTSGRYHTDWLNMMYPRLRLARNLLTEDGIIFASIDDAEVSRLRMLMDEIFGGDNFILEVAWRRTDNQPNIGKVARVKEYILIYAKNNKRVQVGRLPLSDKALKEYRYEDSLGGKFRRGILLDKTRGRHLYPVTTKGGKVLNGPWMVTEKKLKEMDKNNEVYWTSSGDEQPYSKTYLSKSTGAIPNDFWGLEFGSNQRASLEVESLFGKRIFDFPKPVSLLKNIIKLGAAEDSIILDFFSGSASTAEATMQLNADDGGERRFIMVQLPEQTPQDSKAYEAGYRSIPQIAEDRIKLAGDKILSSTPKSGKIIDVGFKVFELGESNIKEWNLDSDNLNKQIEMQLDNISNRSEDLDLVYEIMLKQGLDLSLDVNMIVSGTSRIYKIAFGALFIILGENIRTETAARVIEIIRADGLENVVVVFKDTGFESDADKLNAIEILNAGGIGYDDILSI
ncbi:site-specific DNA-methyltransferase [Lapidilactobacillus luobeiensis]|uniref:site-specific DNA-methyltransferase n=1 Tax=Lapidilactobacillus luobeiensis TaxID=2950371 RepID=UPI0021C3080E|nr:site-specific DNA-methyltransferase [Lapidilactobacillus luobeiensis]